MFFSIWKSRTKNEEKKHTLTRAKASKAWAVLDIKKRNNHRLLLLLFGRLVIYEVVKSIHEKGSSMEFSAEFKQTFPGNIGFRVVAVIPRPNFLSLFCLSSHTWNDRADACTGHVWHLKYGLVVYMFWLVIRIFSHCCCCCCFVSLQNDTIFLKCEWLGDDKSISYTVHQVPIQFTNIRTNANKMLGVYTHTSSTTQILETISPWKIRFGQWIIWKIS